jgi:hypothetical protein
VVSEEEEEIDEELRALIDATIGDIDVPDIFDLPMLPTE